MAISDPEGTKTARFELHKVERERHVKVLHACEGGSRALGLESAKTSDFDVRFIYVRPVTAYLGLGAARLVLDKGDLTPVNNMELNGWDVLKAVSLTADSNPQVLEWLGSPIQYYAMRAFVDDLKDIAGEFSPKRVMHFYVSAAERQRKQKAAGSGEKVPVKGYVYAMRPVLAAMLLSARPEQMPPMLFSDLRDAVRQFPEVRAIDGAISEMIAVKKGGDEAAMQSAIPALDEFLDRMIPRLRQTATDAYEFRSPDPLRLDELCIRTIRQYG